MSAEEQPEEIVEEIRSANNGEKPESDNNGLNTVVYKMAIEPLLSANLDDNQIRNIETYLEQIEKIIEELDSDKLSTGEAIQRLRDISAELSG